MPKKENRVKVEKGTILSMGVGLIFAGAEVIRAGRIVEGICVAGIGFGLLYVREHFKFHHWSSVVGENSYWRGKKGKRGM